MPVRVGRALSWHRWLMLGAGSCCNMTPVALFFTCEYEMGFLRLYLAVTVMFWHSAPDTSRLLPAAFTAVICFFIISGFYISMVLTEKYQDGALRFYANRAVRLYPTYLVVLLCFVVVGYLNLGPLPDVSHHPELKIFGQITVLPCVLWSNLILDPGPGSGFVGLAIGTIYTVGLEMMFYAIAPFFARRSVTVLLALFAVGAVMHLTPHWLGLPARAWQYEFFPGIFVFFIAGALSYRLYRVVNDKPWSHWIGYAALPVLIFYVWAIDQERTNAYANDILGYLLYIGLAVLVPFLFIVTKRSAFDRFLGSLSYPLYVVHVPIINAAIAHGWEPANWIARGVSLAAAVVLAVLIERPLESVRGAIRGDKRFKAANCGMALLWPSRNDLSRTRQ